MTGYNMPPGVNVKDIPVNRPEDGEWEEIINNFINSLTDSEEAIYGSLPSDEESIVFKALDFGISLGYTRAKKEKIMGSERLSSDQIKELWLWCGFRDSYEEQGGRKGWVDPITNEYYGTELPPLDLNNLFKYAIPKLHERNIGFVICNSQRRLPYYVELYCSSGVKGELPTILLNNYDLVMALSQAI